MISSGAIAEIDALLSSQRGRWVLLNFWAVWCRPCVAETPALVALSQEMADRPFTLVGISLDLVVTDEEQVAVRKVTEFAGKYRISYPTIIFNGATDDLIERFSLTGVVPTTILYDPDGREANRWIGALTDSDLEHIRSQIP